MNTENTSRTIAYQMCFLNLLFLLLMSLYFINTNAITDEYRKLSNLIWLETNQIAQHIAFFGSLS